MADIFPRHVETVKKIALLGLPSCRTQSFFASNQSTFITCKIPASGQRLPVIGMGSCITFKLGNDIDFRNQRVEVLRTYFEQDQQLWPL